MKTTHRSWRGELRYNEPMSKHTTWRIGGLAEQFFIPADIEELQTFLSTLPTDEPLLWLGLGSNLLVRDGGIRGTVILTTGLNQLQRLSAGQWHAQAGVSCAKIARQTVKACDMGAEFLAGIPGSWGGALAMNAGAFGGETWNRVKALQTIDRQGVIRQRLPEDFKVAYRSVQGLKDECFLSATVQLQPSDQQQAEAGRLRIQALLQKRRDTQPTRQASCGSVFRNPKPLFAAKLIEDCGLKGLQIGGAQISEKHANFIVNIDQAKAADVEALIAVIMRTVKERYNVTLHPEVCVVGQTA